MLFNDNRILFFDTSNIESMEDMQFTLNIPNKQGPCLWAERDWEIKRVRPSGLIFYNDEYRLYYWINLNEGRMVLAFVTSKDGIKWERPDLGIVEFDGSKNNNICDTGEQLFSEHCVFVDPSASPEHRIKMIFNYLLGGGMGLMTSPDGIHFKRSEGYLLKFFTDNHMISFYDERISKYRIYVRGWDRSRKINDIWGSSRNILLAEVDDLFHPVPYDVSAIRQWPMGPPRKTKYGELHPSLRKMNKELPAVLWCDNDDPTMADLYQSAIVHYSQDTYFSFPTLYYNYPPPPVGFVNDGVMDIQFASSRDGLNWSRSIRQPYVRLDMPGGFATKQLYMLAGIAPQKNTLNQYYVGCTRTHGDGRTSVSINPHLSSQKGDPLVLRLEQRMDGFVSIDSSYTGGRLITKSFVLNSKSLKLNIDTSASGMAKAALLDESGMELEQFRLTDCDIIQDNNTQLTVKWNGKHDLSSLNGKTVKLMLESRATKLFSIYP
jgi:hypothetical protein